MKLGGAGRDLVVRVSTAQDIRVSVHLLLLALDGKDLAGAVEVNVSDLRAGAEHTLTGVLPERWAARRPAFELALVDQRGAERPVSPTPGLYVVPAQQDAMALPGPLPR